MGSKDATRSRLSWRSIRQPLPGKFSGSVPARSYAPTASAMLRRAADGIQDAPGRTLLNRGDRAASHEIGGLAETVMAKARSIVADFTAYLAVRLAVCLLQALPPATTRALARYLAWLAYR